MSEKPPTVYGFFESDACNKYDFRFAASKVPADGRAATNRAEIGADGFVTQRLISKRFVTNAAFVSSNPMTNIGLGTGRGFRYACSQQLRWVGRPFGVRPHTREDAFVEASSTPRLAVSAIGEMEWAT